MKKLKSLIKTFEATTRPADSDSIQTLEHKLGFPLSEEYKGNLSDFGLISFESEETYGLGVPDNYYLNVHSIYTDLSRDTSYPPETVPLLEIGDGQYYLYDNKAQRVLLWSTPNGGVVRTLDEHLEPFLIEKIFGNRGAPDPRSATNS